VTYGVEEKDYGKSETSEEEKESKVTNPTFESNFISAEAKIKVR